MTTWADIKLKTLQKMFAADGNNIPTDTATKDYIASMPGAANEALQMLATAGKFIIKSIDIAHNPVKNLLGDGKHIKSIERGEIKYTTKGARSFYFEYFGEGAYEVLVGGVSTATGTLTKKQGYSSVKALIDNTDDLDTELVFTSDYPLAVKNVALYSANFPTDDDVPSYAEKIRYNLKTLVDDFYMLSTEDIYYEGDANVSRYIRTSDYFQEGRTVLVLDRDTPGNFKVYYKAYPQSITSETEDTEELSLDPEVVALMPLYMASQLYKDDDAGIATTYRNEFEVAFERLRDSVSTPSAERFTSESGWI